MADFWELKRPKRKPITTGWLVAACVVVALWSLIALIVKLSDPATGLVGALSGKATSPEALGFAFGSALGAALIPVVVVWLLLYFVIVRRHAPERGRRHFGVLLAVAMVSSLAAVGLVIAKERVDAEQAQMEIADKEVSAAVSAALDPGPPGMIDPTVKATGEGGEVERLAKRMIVAIQTDRQHYVAELQALGFPAFLTGRRLAADPGLGRTRDKLNKAVAVVAKYHAMNLQRVEEFKAAVSASGALSERHKAQLLAGLEQGLATSRERGDRIWALDAAMVAEFQAAIEDLARARGRWSTSGDKVVFSRQSDLDAFNRHITSLQAMGRESDQIKRDTQAELKAKSAPSEE